VFAPDRTSIPAPAFVIPPVCVASKSVIAEESAIVEPAAAVIVPLLKSFKVSARLGEMPSANVTVPELALSVSDQAVAVVRALPFTLPKTRLLAVVVLPFVIDVVLVELKPFWKVMLVEYKVTPLMVIAAGATVPLVTVPEKRKR